METVPLDYAEIASRPDGVAMLVRLLQARDASEQLLAEQIDKLKRQVEWLTSQLFGRKSEKIDPNQMWLDELLLEALEKNPPAPPPPEVTSEVQSHTRKHTPHGRAEIPEHLPREIEVIDVPESERTLPDGTPRPVIGHEDTERIGYRPGEVFVQVIRRLKYGSPPGAEENGVQIAPMPELLLPRCKADESLIAHLIVSKYVDHLPLNRMESTLERSGISISRSTMCGWLVDAGLALDPLVACARGHLFSSGLVHHDDTPVDLQDYHAGKPKGRQMREARLWVGSCSPRDGPWTVFDFTLGRGAEGPVRFFQDYRGDIVCDAYPGYGRLLVSVRRSTSTAMALLLRSLSAKGIHGYGQDAHKSRAVSSIVPRALGRSDCRTSPQWPEHFTLLPFASSNREPVLLLAQAPGFSSGA